MQPLLKVPTTLRNLQHCNTYPDDPRLEVTKVDLPVPGVLGTDKGSVVDSIVLVRDTVLAAKCALHARIYIISLTTLLEKRTPVKQ